MSLTFGSPVRRTAAKTPKPCSAHGKRETSIRACEENTENGCDARKKRFWVRVPLSCGVDVDLTTDGGQGGGRRTLTIQSSPGRRESGGCPAGSEESRVPLALEPAAERRGARGCSPTPARSDATLRSTGSTHEWAVLRSEDSGRPIYVRKSSADVDIEFDDGRGCRSRVRLHARPRSRGNPNSATDDHSCGRCDSRSVGMMADDSEEPVDLPATSDFHLLRRKWSLKAMNPCSPIRRRSVTVTFDAGSSSSSSGGSHTSLSSENQESLLCHGSGQRSTVSIQWSAEAQGRSREPSWDDLGVELRRRRSSVAAIRRWAINSESDDSEEAGKEERWEWKCGAETAVEDEQEACRGTEGGPGARSEGKRLDEGPCEGTLASCEDTCTPVTELESWEDTMTCPEEVVVSEPELGRATTMGVVAFIVVLVIILVTVVYNSMCLRRSCGYPTVHPF